ncbi:MAG TPA: PA14 domain-containing protein [Kofleriaceae bacterium]|nr:PA14 domain-containing protein [Kofleriaceae bacterium]
MRWLASLLALSAACGFDATGLPPGHVLRDDTVADFTQTGATLDDAEIAAPGLISPSAYVTGAALAKGANSELFADPKTIDWNTLDANQPAKIALAVPLGDFGDKAPAGVGLASNDHWTVWVAGELWLEQGTHMFSLAADDNGLFEVAPSANEAYARVVTSQWFSGEATGTFNAPADGWYPVHLAWSENDQSAKYVLRHQPPGGTLGPIDPDRFRVAAGAQRGLVADAFDDYYLVRPTARSLFAGAMLDQDFGNTTPADTGITANTSYSFHWAAQARIDVGGDYAFTLDTDDGSRLRIDGELLIDQFTNTTQKNTTKTIHLDPGWHDVVIDYTQYAASAHARLKVASGPDLAGGPFPIDRVRPVIPRVDRVGGASDDNDLTFIAGGTASYTLTPPIPAGAIVDGVDVGYTISVSHARDLQISVIAPDGTRAIVRPQGDVDRTGATGERRTTHGLDGKPGNGQWWVEFVDKSGVDAGGTRDAAITVHYTGGHAPIATAAAYESSIRDLGMVSRIDDVQFSADAPMGTAVAVRLRTAATVDALMAQPWSDPVENNAPPIVGAGQFAQYRVELKSDGDHAPSFDWIQLVYRQAQ